MRLIFLFCSLLTTPLSAQQVYVYYDEQGIPHYSDQPSADSVLVNLHVLQPSSTPSPAISLEPDQSAAKMEPLQFKLAILSPQPDESILSNSGELRVQTQTEPQLPEGHQLRLVFDQSQLSPLQRQAGFVLQGIERGEHSLQLQQVDPNGKLIAESSITRFYLRKSTMNSPK